MLRTFGAMPTTMPAGYFKAVRFPVLALVNKASGDHRLLSADGGKSRDLPLSIKAQFATSYGHEGAQLSGGLFYVAIDDAAHPDYGIVSGAGFLSDDPIGRMHARAIHMGMMRGNSVDLADVKARFVEDMETGDYWIDFYEWAIAATTGVSTPAFAQAYAEVDPLTDGELMASLVGEDPMVELTAGWTVDEFLAFAADGAAINVILPTRPAEEVPVELLASGIVQRYDNFHIPETDRPQKIIVTPDNVVYGNLGLWDTPHLGIDGRQVYIPRPRDDYASFNQPGVLTERGIVQTGPIFAYGGHRSMRGGKSRENAYGGIENAWADVRITAGKHGPWISGVVRPGVDDETVYAARASRISGHWLGDDLHAIVSVNGEGFKVKGDPDVDAFALDLASGFAFSTTDEGVLELVASFPDSPTETQSPAPVTITISTASEGFLAALAALTSQNASPAAASQPAAADDHEAWQRAATARLLAGDDHDDE